MKRLSLISLLMILISIPAFSQFWIEFGWNDPYCRQCEQMIEVLRLSPKQTRDYHKIIHNYGKKIEKQARRDYRHWDNAARKIYDLRFDRDRKLQRLLSHQQFDLYLRYTRERPQLIHDHRGWYENPRYASRHHSPDWIRFENNYWGHHWKGHAHVTPPPPKYKQQHKPPKQQPPHYKGGEKGKHKEQASRDQSASKGNKKQQTPGYQSAPKDNKKEQANRGRSNEKKREESKKENKRKDNRSNDRRNR